MTTDTGGPAYPNSSDNTPEYPIFDGMTLLDYFAAHAPDLPTEIVDRRLAVMNTTDTDVMKYPWNDVALGMIATLQRRWRYIYAAAMVAEKHKLEKETT